MSTDIMRCEIGKRVVIKTEHVLESFLSKDKITVKTGDVGFIDSSGLLHYITGEARGKIEKLSGIELEGYDVENIAVLVYDQFIRRFGREFEENLEDTGISREEIISEIECALDEIL